MSGIDGLPTFLIPLVVYAMFAPSRRLVGDPVKVVPDKGFVVGVSM